MKQRAKLLDDDGEQVVLLPPSCCFPAGTTEVTVRREGNGVVLEPVYEWSSDFLSILGSLDEDIPRPGDR
jgi:virulence-associated protein VagC